MQRHAAATIETEDTHALSSITTFKGGLHNSVFRAKMDEVIHVHLHGIMEGRLIVSSINSIQHALNHLGLSNCRAVANGVLLCPALSFKYYGLDEGSDLYLVPPADFTDTKKRAKKKKKPSHLKAARYRDTLQLRPSSQREYARVCDIFRQRVEANPFQYRRVLARAAENLEKAEAQPKESEKTVIPEKPEAPSTDLLPLFVIE